MNSFVKKIFTVSEITHTIKILLETQMAEVWIEGEVSNLRIPHSGHIYFTLKDESSQIRTVLFKSQSRYLKFDIEDGMKILVLGRVSVYEPRGEYQIIAQSVAPKGIGALQKAFEQLKEKLDKKGFFKDEHKKPLPLFPKKIGIVTSLTGAALQDILNVINRRFSNISILIYPVSVQGEAASGEISNAISDLNAIKDIGVVIVARGGGSLEDLWAFNEEIVAKAIFNSSIPIVSAVGHETDFTIADFVSDLRAPTPSAAAELVVQNKKDLSDKIDYLKNRLINFTINNLSGTKGRLDRICEKLNYYTTEKKIRLYQQKIDDLFYRMERGFTYRVSAKKEKVKTLTKHLHYLGPLNKISLFQEIILKKNQQLINAYTSRQTFIKNKAQNLMNRLNAVSPLSTLNRGYSLCQKHPSGEIIKKIDTVNKGDWVDVILSKGSLICSVKEIQNGKKDQI